MLEVLVDDILDLQPLNVEVTFPLFGLPPEGEGFILVPGCEFGDTNKLTALHHAVEEKDFDALLLSIVVCLRELLIILLAGCPYAILDAL